MGWKLKVDYVPLCVKSELSENQCGMETVYGAATRQRTVEREPMWDGNNSSMAKYMLWVYRLSENQCGMETALMCLTRRYQRLR